MYVEAAASDRLTGDSATLVYMPLANPVVLNKIPPIAEVLITSFYAKFNSLL